MASSSVPVADVRPLDRGVEKDDRDKRWNENIVATATTGPFWDTDQEFELKVRINELKRKFHQNRHLRAKCLPSDVKESEVWQMLADFPVSVIKMTSSHGAAASACAYLEDPEMLEDWDRDQDFMLRGNKIPVLPSVTEMLLCIARIPLSYTPAMFDGLVKSFGEVNMSFLMISEKTGESKGYGFVEYKNMETIVYAKSKLSRLNVKDSGLWVEFVDSNLTTFDSLHSKCLYVWNLPPNYYDMADFRKRLSVVVNPPYCQIALKNGRPLSWGLVEFSSAEDAEATFNKLNGTVFETLDGQDSSPRLYKMAYYVPGVRAINLYLKLLENEPVHKGNGFGLLPNPPPPIVYQTFENLRKQNPVFAQNVQKILISEFYGNSKPSERVPSKKSKETFPGFPDSCILTPEQRIIFEMIKRDVDTGTLTPQEGSFILMRDVFGHMPLRPVNPVAMVPQMSPTQGVHFSSQFPGAPSFVHSQPILPVHGWPMAPSVSPPLPHVVQPAVVIPRTQGGWSVSGSNSPSTRGNTPDLMTKSLEEHQLHQNDAHLLKTPPQTPIFHPPSLVPSQTTSLNNSQSSSLGVCNYNPLSKIRPLATSLNGLEGSIPYANDLNRNYAKPIGFEKSVRDDTNGVGSLANSWAVPYKVRKSPSPQRQPKRKLSSGILPTPEASPKGNYIGQHSQGLGGHYSDSYFKRQRRNDDLAP